MDYAFCRKGMRLHALACVLVFVGVATVVGVANATLITYNFETESLAGTSPSPGWTIVGVDGTPQYLTVSGLDGSGLAGQITANHDSNGSEIPGGYVVSSGFDPLQTSVDKPFIVGSFNYRIPALPAGQTNYASGLFLLGDIQTGITESSPGEYLGMFLRRQTFGARAGIVNGAGAVLDTDSNFRINMDQWYDVEFEWAATTGNSGDFSYTVTDRTTMNSWTSSVSGFTLDSPDFYVGFGTGGYFGNAFSPQFDNIRVAAVPEPGTWGLLALLLGSVALYRRKFTKN